MEALKSSFLSPTPFLPNLPSKTVKTPKKPTVTTLSSLSQDPWSLSSGNNPNKPKPKSKNSKNPLSDDNARRIIKSKARYLSELRRNQGGSAQTPRWIKRTPEQMVQYLTDDRNGQMYGKLVVAAVKTVRGLSGLKDGEYDMREVMGSFVMKLSFRDMCVVLKEQKGWRQARDFFRWMKLQHGQSMNDRIIREQLSYHPSVIVYTIVLRAYGQVGKIKLAEQTFLEMLEAGCEPDEVACGTMLCTYARWGRHNAMLSFYSAVQERGISLSIAVFNFMLSSLQKKSLHLKVIDMWINMVEKRVTPNNFTFTVVISSFAKEGYAEEALKTFYEMKNFGFLPEEVIYSLLINLSLKNGHRDTVLELYEDMRSHGIIPSNYTCASLITLHYKHGDYSKALSLFSEMEANKIPADEVIYGLLIRIYGKLGLFEDAQRTFDETRQLGLLTDEKTYVAMTQVYLNSGDFEKALSIMELMRSHEILFSRYSYSVMLQCYCMQKDLGSAEVTFQSLSKTELPDPVSCKTILNLYMKLGLREKANNFIFQIRKDKIEFDEELCKIVMKVYSREGMLRNAEQFIEEMSINRSLKDSIFFQTCFMTKVGQSTTLARLEGMTNALNQPDVVALELMVTMYLTDGNGGNNEEIVKLLIKTASGLSFCSQLIRKFAREGDIYKAETLYSQLLKLGYKPEASANASLISLYGKQQKLKQAEQIFAAVADSSMAEKAIYNSMIEAYVKCGIPDKAYRLYKEVTEKGHDLGAVAVSIVVNSLATYGKFKDAENIIQKSFCDKLELDTVAYNTFIKAMLEAGKLHFATSIYEQMLSLGVSPSIQTYNTMISVYGRGRKLDEAVEVFNVARNSCVSLDEKAYTNLISYCGKAGKIHEASLLFSEMQKDGINPGKVGYNVMLSIYAKAGLDHEAKRLFSDMQKDGFKPDSLTYLSLIRAQTQNLNYSKAEETINSMQKDEIPASCAHYNLLLSAFAKVGLIGEAERVYRKMSDTGLSPNLACKQTILRGYMDFGHVKKGIDFFESISESVKADRFVMSAAVHLYKFAGEERKAEIVLNSMKGLRIPFLETLEVGSKSCAEKTHVNVLDLYKSKL